MYKSVVLIAATAASVAAYTDMRAAIAHNFDMAAIDIEDVREKYGLRYLQAHNPRLDRRVS